jgi:hypothetical protein
MNIERTTLAAWTAAVGISAMAALLPEHAHALAGWRPTMAV